MGLRRVAGWEARLHRLFAHYRHEPFGWGSHDCCTFAGAAVKAIDPSFDWTPGWKDQDEALRAIARGGGVEAAVSAVLGAPIDNWKLARRGDVVLFLEGNDFGVSVCTGRTLCGPGPGHAGLQHMPLKRGLRVWQVG